MKFKTVIFDLGGVVININTQQSFTAFARLADLTEQEVQALASHPAFEQHERGLVSDEVFRNTIRAFTASELTDEAIDQAWNAMLLNIPPERLNLMAELRSRYHTLVLSNTNNIHVQSFNRAINEISGRKGIHEFVHKVYYSHEMGKRKPNPEIFDQVIHQEKIRPEQTLFLDDKLENVNAAKQMGLQAVQITPERDLINFFATL